MLRFLALFAVFLGLSSSLVWASTLNFYASPNGSDHENGLTLNTAVTLKKAQLLARQSAVQGNEVWVTLLAGRYELKDTLYFNQEDSNTHYQGITGGKVILSGGIEIQGFKESSPHLFQAPLPPELKNFRQLYAFKNDSPVTRPTRARSNMGQIDDWNGDGKGSFVIRNAHWVIKTPKTFNDHYPELVVHRDWTQSRLRIKKIIPIGIDRFKVVPVSEDAKRELVKNIPLKKVGQAAFFENSSDFFAETLFSNQWFLDLDQKTISYFNLNHSAQEFRFFAPRLEHLIEIDGAKNLSFENLYFSESTWLDPSETGYTGIQASFIETKSNEWRAMPAAIVAKNTENLVFKNNVFRNLGASGLELTSGTHHTLVEGNRFTDLAGSGIQVYTDVGPLGVDPSTQMPTNANMNPEVQNRSISDVIRNNYVDHIGLDYYGAVGIFATYPESIRIENNEVYSMPYTGISLGWGWTLVKSALKDNQVIGNDVHHVMEFLDDGGGLYFLSNQQSTRVENNFIHDLRNDAYSGRRPLVPIYLDNNVAGITLSHNSCVSNANIQATIPGVFFRAEASPLNTIESCFQSLNDVISQVGPDQKFRFMKYRD